MERLTIKEVNSTNLESVDKMIKCLRYMNQGHELVIDGFRIKVAENIDGSFSIIQVGTSTDTKTNQTIEIPLGIPFEYFVRLVKKITEEEFTVMSANLALNQITKKRSLALPIDGKEVEGGNK